MIEEISPNEALDHEFIAPETGYSKKNAEDTKIVIPEGKLASETEKTESNSLGIIEVGNDQFELYMEEDLDFDLNLYIKDEAGATHTLIQLLANYNDRSGHHEGIVSVTDQRLYSNFNADPQGERLIDQYLAIVQNRQEEYLLKRDRESNSHRIKLHEIDINGQSRKLELIYQIQAGDCVLANYLNTYSLENSGQIPMTVDEARRGAINQRRQAGEDASDIISPNSALSYKDVVRLFSTIHGQKPKQEDVLAVEAEQLSSSELKLKILTVLDYLDTYPSGLCTTGMGYHSRSIKKLEDDNYALIDPMNPDGIEKLNTDSLLELLSRLCQNRPANENFFFFVRN